MQTKLHFFISFFLLFVAGAQSAMAQYAIAAKPWEEKYGNHRAVINIKKPAEVVSLQYEWRRPDKDVDKRKFLVINASTGDTVKNIERIEVNNERCHIRFGPVKQAGTYYFYYLPYEVQPGHGFYNKNYYPREETASADWLIKSRRLEKNVQNAKIVSIESRTGFDSFFPMEVAASAKEAAVYQKKFTSDFYLFPEDRKFPIRMREKLPLKWMNVKPGMAFKGQAQPNEYYAFQIGVWSPDTKITDIRYTASALKTSNGNEIPAQAFTCFNTEGVDPYGKKFEKKLNISKGFVQPLWFGIDIPKNQSPGIYKGTITIAGDKGVSKKVPVELTVSGSDLADRGDSEPWRHSRLRWLNSTLGISDEPIKPYTPVSFSNNQISVLGRNITVNPTSGLPRQIEAWNKPILSESIQFIIETSKGIKQISMQIKSSNSTAGSVRLRLAGEDPDVLLELHSISEFDGWSNYAYKITSKNEIEIKDIRLEILMNKNTARFFMGTGLPGQAMPKQFEGKWEAKGKKQNEVTVSLPTNEGNSWLHPFDAFWMGSAEAGLHVELGGASYTGPLLNLYRPAYPESWYNNGKGGFALKETESGSRMTVYSGARNLKKGEKIDFEFATIITPVKPVNYRSQFTDRYFHNPRPTEEDLKSGIKIINVHHANPLNPVINYPFVMVDTLKHFVDSWHKKGAKVKIYYTIRELTNAVTEIWALRSLGDEILRSGNSGSFSTLGGYPWLREHFVTDYTPQWYQHFENPAIAGGVQADASVLTAVGDSRWYNYYVEGLKWLVENVGIDGLYLDDVAYDRRMLKRMRRAMASVKEGCVIDLHSNTGFSRGPATQYTEYFPYVDKLWFGESFMYDQMSPDNWLVEVSGIPFGLMGDMLHAGGNRWLGMQYGMTVRYPWFTEGVFVDPRPVWKIWDEFGIQDAKMIGFWEDNVPVKTNNESIKITSYIKPGETLISLGNYSDSSTTFTLDHINWQQLGLHPEKIQLIIPEIEDFQQASMLKVPDKITIDGRKGLLMYIKQIP